MSKGEGLLVRGYRQKAKGSWLLPSSFWLVVTFLLYDCPPSLFPACGLRCVCGDWLVSISHLCVWGGKVDRACKERCWECLVFKFELPTTLWHWLIPSNWERSIDTTRIDVLLNKEERHLTTFHTARGMAKLGLLGLLGWGWMGGWN